LNHLLKSPFCVHPKTGRVCVPIDLEKLDQFDPLNVPMVDELCEQLERCDLINLDKKIKGKISDLIKKKEMKKSLKMNIAVLIFYHAKTLRFSN
jgi:DNA primase small subunit